VSIDMKTLQWAVVVLALEVLLLCGYFDVLEMGCFSWRWPRLATPNW
jgi:hypothetical protein